MVFEQFVGHRPQQVVERDDERLVGHGQLGVACAVRHGSPATTSPPGELGGEPGLARTCFTADQHRLARSGAHRRPGLEQCLPLTRATDEGNAALHCQRRRQRDGERAVRKCQVDRAPLDLVRVDRLGKTLHWQRVECPEPSPRPVTGKLTDERARHDLSGRGRRLQSSGHDHRQAVTVTVLPADVTDPQTDPHLHRREATGDALLHGNRRQHGVSRRFEGRHDPVARRLHHRAPVIGDDLLQAPFVVAEQLVGGCFTQFGSQRRRLHRIGEEDRRRGCRHDRPFPQRGEPTSQD